MKSDIRYCNGQHLSLPLKCLSLPLIPTTSGDLQCTGEPAACLAVLVVCTFQKLFSELFFKQQASVYCASIILCLSSPFRRCVSSIFSAVLLMCLCSSLTMMMGCLWIPVLFLCTEPVLCPQCWHNRQQTLHKNPPPAAWSGFTPLASLVFLFFIFFLRRMSYICII